MSSRVTKRWSEIQGSKPLNAPRSAAFARLMEAEEQITQACLRRGVSDTQIDRALEISEAELEKIADDDLVVTALRRFVVELGGRLEVTSSGEARAVFPQDTVVIPGVNRAS